MPDINEVVANLARKVQRQQSKPRGIKTGAALQTSEERLWLRFSTGKIVDTKRCPLGLHAHWHWQLTEPEITDAPNSECLCEPATTQKEDAE